MFSQFYAARVTGQVIDSKTNLPHREVANERHYRVRVAQILETGDRRRNSPSVKLFKRRREKIERSAELIATVVARTSVTTRGSHRISKET